MKTFEYGTILLLLALIAIQNYIVQVELQKDIKQLKNNENNYFERKYKNGTEYYVDGMNIGDCGYFVSTKNEDISKILDTDYHEACHEFIREDRERNAYKATIF